MSVNSTTPVSVSNVTTGIFRNPGLEASLLQTYLIYTVLGAIAIVANVLVLAGILASKTLRKQQIIEMALMLGDLANGAGYFSQGIFNVVNGLDYTMITGYQCMMFYPQVPLRLIGKMLPGWATLALGFERIFAAAAPIGYRNRWSQKVAWTVNGAILVATAIPLIVVYAIAKESGVPLTPVYSCNNVNIAVKQFDPYAYYETAVCGIISLILTCAAMIIGFRALGRVQQGNAAQAEYRHFRRQVRITRIVCCLVVKQFLFFICPNIFFSLLYLLDAQTQAALGVYAGKITPIYICNSILNLPVFLIMNAEFRKYCSVALWASLKFVSRGKLQKKNTITPTPIVTVTKARRVSKPVRHETPF